jgi:outer membrane murein-binding lipoprotein Lpp
MNRNFLKMLVELAFNFCIGYIIGFVLGGLFLLIVFTVSGCGSEEHRTARSDGLSTQIEDLRIQIEEIRLIADDFTEGIDSEFTDCSVVTNAVEKKICQIAQTFNTQQQLEIKSQLGTMAKELQKALFGEDCINTTDVGCPVVNSIAAKLTQLELGVAANKTDIASIKTRVSTLETNISGLTDRIAALESRFSNFNGSGQTVEAFVGVIKSDVTTLQTQVASIQSVLSSGRILNAYSLCGDNPDSGPIYEMIAITGDKATAYGYVRTSSREGLGSFFKAGNTNTFYTTSINSKNCNFKMYNDPTSTKVQACWISSNRRATSAQIDAARTAGTASCTPY